MNSMDYQKGRFLRNLALCRDFRDTRFFETIEMLSFSKTIDFLETYLKKFFSEQFEHHIMEKFQFEISIYIQPDV